MKTFDVIVGKQNGHFLASVRDYPHLAQIGATAEEAVGKAKSAMEEFLTTAQVVTVAVNAPEANGSSVQQLQAAADAAEIAASEYPLAEAWARRAGLRKQDPNDPDYQSFLASLAFLKQQDREYSRREAERLENETYAEPLRQREAIEREFAIAAELNSPHANLQRGSLSSLIRAAADCRINTGSAMYKEYEAELETAARDWLNTAGNEIYAESQREPEAMELSAEKLYRRDAIKRELEIADALSDPTPAWPPGSPQAALNTIAACRIDPNDKLYQQYVAVLEAEEQQQREEFERENSAAA